MTINLTKIIDQIQTRINDSTQSDRSLDQLIRIANRIDNSGTQVLSYKSIGQLPSTSDSAYVGTIAYVETDNVFGDSSGRFVFASGRDSGWLKFTTIQDSDEAAIEAPGGGSSAPAFGKAQGSISGYLTGGVNPGLSPTVSNQIQKYSLTADENSTDVGDLTGRVHYHTSTGSDTHGYRAGGSGPGYNNIIDKWSFTVDGNATDVGDLTESKGYTASWDTPTHGYVVGGLPGPTYTNVIEKYAYASDGNGTDVGDITSNRYSMTGIFSPTTGYAVGGVSVPEGSPFWKSDIQKMPFASEGNSAGISDTVPAGRADTTPNNTSDHGYLSGGTTPGVRNTIFKYSFAEGTNATDIGDLIQATQRSAGSNSTTHGYVGGGQPTSNIIQKFPFSADENSADVGNLLGNYGYTAGTQI